MIAQHTRPDGSTNAPMRIAHTRVDLGIVAARRGDLDGAVTYGESAFEFDRVSVTDLLARTSELDRTIQQRYRGERLAREFHERHLNATRLIEGRELTAVTARRPSYLRKRLTGGQNGGMPQQPPSPSPSRGAARYPALSAQLRERVDGAAVGRAMKSQAASTGIRLLRLAASFAADSTNESTDVTASLAVAADGRYYVDPGGKAPHAGMERVVCDGEHRWLWAGNRLFCWPPEPLPKGIAAFMDPAPLIRSHGRQGGTTEVDGRTGRTVTASFPRLVPVTAPLSLHSMSADEAEFVIDDRLGVALRARWIHQGEALLCTELANVTETVDDQLFRVEPQPGMRVTTTRNPLAFVTAREVTESARLFTTDLAKWISRPRH